MGKFGLEHFALNSNAIPQLKRKGKENIKFSGGN